jgi:hypothetical protein
MNTQPSKLSWASQQAVAIMAVDNLQISPATLALMQAVDAGTMTHDEAIKNVLKRAAEYAELSNFKER